MFKKISDGLMYLCYICLVYGILLLLGDVGKCSYRPWWIWGNILVVSGAVWFGWGYKKAHLSRKRKKWGALAVLLLIVLYSSFFFRQREMLDKQFHRFLLCLTKMEESAEDFTLLFSYFSFLLSLLCFFIAFVLKKGWVFYGITLPLLFLGPLFGYHFSWRILFLFLFFHIGHGIFCTVYQKWNDEPEGKNSRALVLEKGIFAAVSAVLVSFFLACLIPAGNRKAWMKNSVEFAHTWRRNVSDGSSIVPEGVSGKISRGNHYSSGTVQMEVSLSLPPADRIYLKSFTGGRYEGDGWAEADEKDYTPTWNFPQGENTLSLSPAYFEWRQFELIQYGKLEDWKDVSAYPWLSQEYQEWSGMQKMGIRPFGSLQRTFFIPYLSVYTSRDAEGAYHYFQFSWEDYKEYQQRINEEPLQWFEQLEAPYREYASQHYLQVPEEKLPRLLALCRENPLEDPEEITDFIGQTLVQYAAYSQTPGFMPYGTDIAEYFLFDGQEGYCQHFATAAVLMYRMYGIPARYAAGYMADPGDFTQDRDGHYYAVLTDQKAHAWAEIYLGGPGWIPIEVTPASEEGQGSGGGTENFFSYARNWFKERNKEEASEDAGKGTEEAVDGIGEVEDNGDSRWNQEKENESFFQEPSEDDEGEAIGETGLEGQEDESLIEEEVKADEEESTLEHGFEGNAEKGTKWWTAALLSLFRFLFSAAKVCIPLILLLAGMVWAGEKLTRKKLESLRADELYQNIVGLFHLGGYLIEYDGTEPDFAQAAAKAGEQINDLGKNRRNFLAFEEIKKIKTYAFQTAYGREISSDKEREQVMDAYQQIYTALFSHLRGINKIIFGLRAAVRIINTERTSRNG